jgi:hypothetical protein
MDSRAAIFLGKLTRTVQSQRRLEPGSGQEAFLPELSSSFSDVRCQGQPAGGKTKKGKINMKLQNLIHILILIICLGLLPKARAVGPDTDGTIPGSNNGEGVGVLVSRTSGVWNTGAEQSVKRPLCQEYGITNH